MNVNNSNEFTNIGIQNYSKECNSLSEEDRKKQAQQKCYEEISQLEMVKGLIFEKFVEQFGKSYDLVKKLMMGQTAEQIAKANIVLKDLKDYDVFFVLKEKELKEIFEFIQLWMEKINDWENIQLIPADFLPKKAEYFKLKMGKFEITFSIINDYSARRVIYVDGYEYDISEKEIKYPPKFKSQEEFEEVKNSTQLRDFEEPIKELDFPIHRIIKGGIQGYDLPSKYLIEYFQKFNEFLQKDKDLDSYAPDFAIYKKIVKTITAENLTAKLVSSLTYIFDAYCLSTKGIDIDCWRIQKNAHDEIRKILNENKECYSENKGCYSLFLYDLCFAIVQPRIDKNKSLEEQQQLEDLFREKCVEDVEKQYANQALLQLFIGMDLLSSEVKHIRFSQDGTVRFYSSEDEKILPNGKIWEHVHLSIYSVNGIAQKILKAPWLTQIDIFKNEKFKTFSKNSKKITLQEFFKKIPILLSENLDKFEYKIPKNLTLDLLFDRWNTVLKQWKCDGDSPEAYLNNIAMMITLASLLDSDHKYVQEWFNSYNKIWFEQITKDNKFVKKYIIPVYPLEKQFQGLIEQVKKSEKIEFPTLHEIVKVMVAEADEKTSHKLLSELISYCGTSEDKDFYTEMKSVMGILIHDFHDDSKEQNEWLISWIINPSMIYNPLEMKKIQQGRDKDKIALTFNKIISTDNVEKTEHVNKIIESSSSFQSCSQKVQRSIVKIILSLIGKWISKKNRPLNEIKEMWNTAKKWDVLKKDKDIEKTEMQLDLMNRFVCEFFDLDVDGVACALPLFEKQLELKTIKNSSDLILKGGQASIKAKKWKLALQLLEMTQKSEIKNISDLLNTLLLESMESDTDIKSLEEKNAFIHKILNHSELKISSEMAKKYIGIFSKIAPEKTVQWIIEYKIYSPNALKDVWSVIKKRFQGINRGCCVFGHPS